MPLLSHAIFGIMRMVSRRGLTLPRAGESQKKHARRHGINGETYAYWYLRRHGYVFVARNYRASGDKAEIDLVGYDGPVLAFIEVKTRSGTDTRPGQPEEAVNANKRLHIERMAKRFLAERRIPGVSWRFDLVAIETQQGKPPNVRLHKNAFSSGH